MLKKRCHYKLYVFFIRINKKHHHPHMKNQAIWTRHATAAAGTKEKHCGVFGALWEKAGAYEPTDGMLISGWLGLLIDELRAKRLIADDQTQCTIKHIASKNQIKVTLNCNYQNHFKIMQSIECLLTYLNPQDEDVRIDSHVTELVDPHANPWQHNKAHFLGVVLHFRRNFLCNSTANGAWLIRNEFHV